MRKLINISGKLFLSVLIVSYFSLICNAQIKEKLGIDSLKITPNNPTTEDSVKAISFITAPGQSIIDTTLASIEDSLILISIYGTEMFPYTDGITQLSDTIILGKLQSGKYYLVEHHYGRQQQEDSTYTQYSLGSISDTLQFLISSLGTVDFIKNDNKFLIYPNPTRNTLTIFLNGSEILCKYNLEIHTIKGEKLSSKNIYKSTALDLSDYAPGIYLLTIKHNNKIIQTEKLIVE